MLDAPAAASPTRTNERPPQSANSGSEPPTGMPSPSPPPKDQLYVDNSGEAWDPSKGLPWTYTDGGDLNQGRLGDCYFLSSIGAIAETNPQHLAKHLKDNGNGTYTATFYQRTADLRPAGPGSSMPNGQQYVPVQVTVSMKDIKDANGNPRYAGYGDVGANGNREVWPMVYEAAYAKWKGGYDKIGGGFGGQAMSELTGKPSTTKDVSDVSPEDLRNRLANGQAVTLSTNAKDEGVVGWLRSRVGRNDNDILYRNGTLIGSHAYMVRGVTQDNKVILVNPHAGQEVVVPYQDLARACSWGSFSFNGGMPQ
jgi:hypothetical protein